MRLAVTLCLAAMPACAETWHTPAKGSAERKALMEAIRPLAAEALGRKVEFVVNELRVSGAVAMAMLDPQRPGGKEIDLSNTPAAARGEIDPSFQGDNIEAFFVKRKGQWRVQDWNLGATDVWFISAPMCARYADVIMDFCASSG